MQFSDKLDSALIRSGLPGRAELVAILREHLGDDLRGEDLSGAALAGSGLTGADCERLVRGARRRARASGRDMLTSDLLDEIGGTDTRTAQDFRTAAFHEAGHVVVAQSLWPGSVGMATLRGTSGGGGFMEAFPGGQCLIRESNVDSHLAMLLAGRAAECAECGDPSSGAGPTATWPGRRYWRRSRTPPLASGTTAWASCGAGCQIQPLAGNSGR